MVWDLKCKTVRWRFVESLEPPQVVQVRCSSLLNQGNMYGQVTVRMHSRQVRHFAFLSGCASASGVRGVAAQDRGTARCAFPHVVPSAASV